VTLDVLKPREALNKAFLKSRVHRSSIDLFKTNLIRLLDRSNDVESEEYHKNLVSDFLKRTFYNNAHFINTKGRNDLVIHKNSEPDSPVTVIIEAKKPTNSAEMLSTTNVNKKAFHELILYYLRERISNNNLEVKHLIATNVYEWFIFDVSVFEKLFGQNKQLIELFLDFENGRLVKSTTDFFYREIAAPAVKAVHDDISFAHFDLLDYEEALRNSQTNDDRALVPLFKLLSPEALINFLFSSCTASEPSLLKSYASRNSNMYSSVLISPLLFRPN